MVSYKRVKAIVIHYFYLTRYNLTLLVDIVFFPILDLMLWGFTIFYLRNIQSVPFNFTTSFLAASFFWLIVFRSQTAISVPFLNDVTSGNTPALFISPLTDLEFTLGIIIVSFIKLLGTILVMSLLCLLLFSFNIYKLGFYLIPFFINLLISGWALGILANAFLIRFSGRIIFISWFFSLAIQPLSCTFYTRSTLPFFLRQLTYLVPPSYIFEGIRLVVFNNFFNFKDVVYSFILNIFYLFISFYFFKFMKNWAKKSGSLASTF